ncbi:MAG: hypothetical protein RLY43_1248 [Bacteroidota bacterium]|jgi:phosphoenolpyruvate-protein kinase (PTS system EI component)
MINESNTCGGRRGCMANNQLPQCCTIVYVYSEVVRAGDDTESILRTAKLGMDQTKENKAKQNYKTSIETAWAVRILSGLLDFPCYKLN